jgi:hypothetical protein
VDGHIDNPAESSPQSECTDSIQINRPYVLLVEGKEEVKFFKAFLDRLGLNEVQVLTYGGKQRLQEFLKALGAFRGTDQIKILGIERDADNDAKGAFQSVQGSLKKNGYPCPKNQLQLAGGSPAVVVMILPGNGREGMLEDLCLESVKRDPAVACLDEYFRCLNKAGLKKSKNISKARVHAFLASREIPDKRLGEAAQAKYWRLDSGAFRELKKFILMVAGKK